MSTKTNDDLARALAIRLNLVAKAKLHSAPEDNPLHEATLEDVTLGHAALRSSADRIPAKNVAAVDDVTTAGLLLEGARIQVNKDGKDLKAARRARAARARAKKKMALDAIIASDVRPDPERIAEAWEVAILVYPEIERLARSKQRWAERFLGTIVEDVPQVVVERVMQVVAKSDYDTDLLIKAAIAVAKQATPKKKEVRKARKWLGGMVYNMVMGALVDLYTSGENLRWQNIDIIATVMASISGVGEDPMLSSFKADRAPAFLGTKFQAPGTIDYDVLTAAVAGAIHYYGLDDLADLLLSDDPEVVRTDGSIRWLNIAEQVFKATPGDGEMRWHLVQAATKHLSKRTRKESISKAAMQHARNHFAWLPGLIVDVVRAHDVHVVAYGVRPVLASDWEWDYLAYHREDPDPLGEQRFPLQPALAYASTEEAAAALGEVLQLIEARDFVASGA